MALSYEALKNNPRFKVILSQETTDPSILKAPTINEQLSEANKGDSFASETVVSQPETTKIPSIKESHEVTLSTAARVPTPSIISNQEAHTPSMDIQLNHTAKVIDQLLIELGDFKNSFQASKHAHSKALDGVGNVISTFSGNEELVFKKLNELISVVTLIRSE